MVDLSTNEFDLRDAAEAGSWCHLNHPVTGQPLGDWDGDTFKPARILIQGLESKGFDKAVARTAAEEARETKYVGPITEQYLITSADKENRRISQRLAQISLAWENLSWDGKPIDNAHIAGDAYAALKWMREQLLAHAAERGNYAGNGLAPS